MAAADVHQLFHDAMSHLASGVSVITAQREDGAPCGLAATAVASYSAQPPSLLVSVDHASRCHDHLVSCREFGVHILSAADEPLARVFAGKGDDKFAALDWSWDDRVPRLEGALAYLRCHRAENFGRYDHTILIGDIVAGVMGAGEPLLYSRRRMNWSLQPVDGPCSSRPFAAE